MTKTFGEQSIAVTNGDSRASQPGNSDWFTGAVRVEMLFPAKEPGRTAAASVTFQPGARTAWHTHPAGQALIVTDGAGWVQSWGGARQEMRTGDVIQIPAGVKHWHGATTSTTMTHIAVHEEINGTAVEWLEKVTDDQYSGSVNR